MGGCQDTDIDPQSQCQMQCLKRRPHILRLVTCNDTICYFNTNLSD